MIASDTDSFSENNSSNNSMTDDEEMSIEDEKHLLENELTNIEFGKILKAQEKLEKQGKASKTIQNKTTIFLKNKFEKINSKKKKDAPKENSALIKPNKLKQFVAKEKSMQKAFLSIDPRFDNFNNENNNKSKTGEVTSKRYSFVSEEANKYLNNLKDIKKEINLNEDEIDAIKAQKNQVKNYLSSLKHKDIKKTVEERLKKETKNKEELKDKQMIKKLISEEKDKLRTTDEEKRFLKRKTTKQNTKFKRNSEFIN